MGNISNVTLDVFQCLKERKTQQQLICFPYLGGYANVFLKLATILKEDIEVWSLNLPGHGSSKEKSLEDINSVIDLSFQLLQPIAKSNYVFYGHSMGGIIAYFLTQRIMKEPQYLIKPSALILSASAPPSDFNDKKYSSLADPDLIAHIITYEGISKELIQEKSLLEYLLPIFRADFKILESSASCEFKPLDIPVYFFWGEADKIVSIDTAIKWSKYFSQNIKLIPIPNGRHLFVQDQVEYIAKQLESIFIHDIKCELTVLDEIKYC